MSKILSFIANKIFSTNSSADYLKGKTIIPQYEPPSDLTAPELGLLIDQRSGRLEFLATIYHLKTKKVIALSRGGSGSLTIRLLQYQKNELETYEDLLLRFFFREKREVILDHFFKTQDYSVVQSYFQYQVMQSLQSKGYLFVETGFESKPYGEYLEDIVSDALKLVSYITTYLAGGVGKYLTEKSKQNFPLWEGFKQYIETAELDKIKFHAQGNLEEYIELLTPYAVALGQMERWRIIGIPLFVALQPDQAKSAEYKSESLDPAGSINSVIESIHRLDSYSVTLE